MDNNNPRNIGYDNTPAGGVPVGGASNYDQNMVIGGGYSQINSSYQYGQLPFDDPMGTQNMTAPGVNRAYIGNPFLQDEKMRLVP